MGGKVLSKVMAKASLGIKEVNHGIVNAARLEGIWKAIQKTQNLRALVCKMET